MARRIRLGLVGVGKIARDQHLPALAADGRFDVVATASRHGQVEGVPGHGDIDAMLAGGHALDAVSLCTPPGGRYHQARAAIDAGLHVMLEKPPAATLSEITDLAARAAARGVTLFTAWHAREAAGVARARAWLADTAIQRVRIDWREDIRRWHPGQEWILAAGGFGVFDPGINALSIATHILPEPLRLDTARMDVPRGRAAPLVAELAMRCGDAPVTAAFDFLQAGPQCWDIQVDTDRGPLRLSMGGAVLHLPDAEPQHGPDREYSRLYARFADHIAARTCDADVRPLEIVADAFLRADRRTSGAFAF